jgi:hypothetical protein
MALAMPWRIRHSSAPAATTACRARWCRQARPSSRRGLCSRSRPATPQASRGREVGVLVVVRTDRGRPACPGAGRPGRPPAVPTVRHMPGRGCRRPGQDRARRATEARRADEVANVVVGDRDAVPLGEVVGGIRIDRSGIGSGRASGPPQRARQRRASTERLATPDPGPMTSRPVAAPPVPPPLRLCAPALAIQTGSCPDSL